MTSLGWLEQLVIAAYLAVVLLISWTAARKQHTGVDYFLAGRSMSGTKLAMSIVANGLLLLRFAFLRFGSDVDLECMR